MHLECFYFMCHTLPWILDVRPRCAHLQLAGLGTPQNRGSLRTQDIADPETSGSAVG